MQKYSLGTVNMNADLYIFGDINVRPWMKKIEMLWDREGTEKSKQIRLMSIIPCGGDVSEDQIYNTLKNHKVDCDNL